MQFVKGAAIILKHFSIQPLQCSALPCPKKQKKKKREHLQSTCPTTLQHGLLMGITGSPTKHSCAIPASPQNGSDVLTVNPFCPTPEFQ